MGEAADSRIFAAATLGVAAVFAALLGARAAMLFDTASSDLESAVRIQVKSGAALVEDVRFVYQGEAPQAFHYARAKVLTEELRGVAATRSGLARENTLAEAEAQEQLAGALRKASDIAKSGKYDVAGGAFDVGKRLADVRNRDPDLVALNPEGLQHDGGRAAWHANLVLAVTLAPAVAFLLGAIAQALAPFRRTLLTVAWLLILAGVAAAAVFEVTLP
jgi:hypothetical protein